MKKKKSLDSCECYTKEQSGRQATNVPTNLNRTTNRMCDRQQCDDNIGPLYTGDRVVERARASACVCKIRKKKGKITYKGKMSSNESTQVRTHIDEWTWTAKKK